MGGPSSGPGGRPDSGPRFNPLDVIVHTNQSFKYSTHI